MFLWFFHCRSLNIEQMIYLRPSLKPVCSLTCSEGFLNDRAAVTNPRHHLVWSSGHARIRTSSVFCSLGPWPISWSHLMKALATGQIANSKFDWCCLVEMTVHILVLLLFMEDSEKDYTGALREAGKQCYSKGCQRPCPAMVCNYIHIIHQGPFC